MNENNKKTYTSAEMREAADTFWVGGVICEVKDAEGRVVRHIKDDVIKAMLRQAANSNEELTNLRVNVNRLREEVTSKQNSINPLRNENRKLKAHIEEVVKECESQMPNCRLEEGKCNPNDGGYCEHCEEIKVRDALMAVLKVARGEEECK